MQQQEAKKEFSVNNAETSQNTVIAAVASNPRIIQLDTILNRSRFIWAREQSQQASNNN